jgi:hypothetical protein
MSLDFPNSPSVGQTFNSGSGAIYVWDGVAWSIATSQTKTARRTNLVINGALAISQENGNTEGTTDGYYAADQMFGRFIAASAAFGLARIANANPSGSQFRLRYRVTTAKASLAAGDLASINTRLEGLNTQDLGWSNTATQKDAVLSFGFNGPAGTYAVAVRNGTPATYSFLASFVITAGQANTDTIQVIKVPAPGAMTTWAVDNTIAIELCITFAVGSTNAAPAGWNSGNFWGVTGMSNGLAAIQSFQAWDFYFGADPDKTGVPPSFEVPNYGDEYARCQRYYQKLTTLFLAGYSNAGNAIYESYSLPVATRAPPSTAFANIANVTNCANLVVAAATANNVSAAVTVSATGAASLNFDYVLASRM